MRFLFLMDPLESINAEKDTTFMFMLGSHRRGHDVYYLREDGISLRDGKLYFHVIKVQPQHVVHMPFIEEHAAVLSHDEIHAVFIRPDPPFDAHYLMNTWLLDHLPARVAVINRPDGIRTVNEKVWAAQFTDLVPPTVVSCDKKELLNFTQTHRNAIAKPTNGFGGQSVFHLEHGHTNTHVILENLSKNYTETIIVQKYVHEAKDGDKRILLLNGDILGAVLRLHSDDDHRNNFFAGGKPKTASITERDRQIVATLKPHLQRLGLYFVGIDILGDYLIEVNVTSPTGLQEINRLNNVQLEEKVIEFVEQLIQ